MMLGTVFFNSKMAKFIFFKKEGKSLCGGSHRFDKFDLKQAVDRASTGLPDPSVAAPAASPSGSAAPRGGPVGECSAGSASVLLQRLVLLRTLGCCSSNGVGGKCKRGLKAQVCTAVGAREGALGNGCGQRAAAENWIYVSDQHRTKGALGLSDHLPLSLRLFSLSLSLSRFSISSVVSFSFYLLIFVLNTIYARSRRTLADGVPIRQKSIGVQFCDISWFRRSSI